MPNERFSRIESLGLTIAEVAQSLTVTRQFVQDWLDEALPAEESDVVEVGIALLEMRLRSARALRDVPTERLLQVA